MLLIGQSLPENKRYLKTASEWGNEINTHREVLVGGRKDFIITTQNVLDGTMVVLYMVPGEKKNKNLYRSDRVRC